MKRILSGRGMDGSGERYGGGEGWLKNGFE